MQSPSKSRDRRLQRAKQTRTGRALTGNAMAMASMTGRPQPSPRVGNTNAFAIPYLRGQGGHHTCAPHSPKHSPLPQALTSVSALRGTNPLATTPPELQHHFNQASNSDTRLVPAIAIAIAHPTQKECCRNAAWRKDEAIRPHQGDWERYEG